MEIGIIGESDDFATKSCVPSIVPAIGFLLLLNDDCNVGLSGHQNVNVTSKQSTFITPIDTSITNEQRKFLVPDDKLQIQKIETNATIGTTKLDASPSYYYSSISDLQHEFRTTTNVTNTIGMFTELTSKSEQVRTDCKSGFSIYIEVIDGIEVIAEGLATFQTRTLEMCLYICTENKLNDRNFSPIGCHSAQYNRISKRCILFNTSIAPTGNAKYISNKDTVYFEKICISDMVHNKCSIILHRTPQHILVGHATAVINAPSHNYCIEICLRSTEMLNFICRSAIYFHEYQRSNCILNKDSAKTRPKYFINEKEQKLDYIEMDECLIRDRK
ncbi:hypothetical protein LOAG_07529 [Loa loa]|uniref:Apple domain-containing protein n=1 Tax=Loa loa TaxID=7209 RepID=A0A1S0TVK0_LOALO|nr:hypothetical protein LOAG_07529 [Loa loa]EFO20959.2 hypothetical protein LOAG_07529 [Loa loa]